MDEIELRLHALEMLNVELLSYAEKPLLAKLEAGLREGLARPGEPGHGSDEYLVRLQAVQHVQAAALRWKLFTGGTRKPDA